VSERRDLKALARLYDEYRRAASDAALASEDYMLSEDLSEEHKREVAALTQLRDAIRAGVFDRHLNNIIGWAQDRQADKGSREAAW